MTNNNWYESRLDKIFAKGALWKHRTFRTIFDPLSSEWRHTTIDQKIEILERVVNEGEDLKKLIKDYKNRYLEQNRRDIAVSVESALVILLEYKLKKQQ
jgi:hypothetical protein